MMMQRARAHRLRLTRPFTSNDAPAIPLDAIIDKPPPSVFLRPPAASTRALACRLRALVAGSQAPAALNILKSSIGPPSRLVLHTTAHALLRSGPDAAALLLAYADKPFPPRIHFLTLNTALDVLLKQVPRAQQAHDVPRSAPRPALLYLSSHLVSHPHLREATALFIAARALFIRRRQETVTRLWQALLTQREWIVAALVVDLLVKDRQLHMTLPALLERGLLPNGNSEPMTPEDHTYLTRRLALLCLERLRPPRAL
ncbi:hypothetical protein C8J57DRAFT_1588011 [Mycena rebaudengoi]|nr:hypothetical protein C8J57DRAFT_1588011 [Mycena rebaudengoi]